MKASILKKNVLDHDSPPHPVCTIVRHLRGCVMKSYPELNKWKTVFEMALKCERGTRWSFEVDKNGFFLLVPKTVAVYLNMEDKIKQILGQMRPNCLSLLDLS
jgi:hypothetical protein